MRSIREARSDEAELLFQIQREASLAAYAHIFPRELYPFPDEEVRALSCERLADPEMRTLVADHEGRPVGYVSYRRGRLDSLFVLPAAQGTGIGSALHDEAVASQRGLGEPRFSLWVLAENHQARRFYERRGWRADGRTREVPFPPHPTALAYTLELS